MDAHLPLPGVEGEHVLAPSFSAPEAPVPTVYLVLAILGAVLPYAAFAPLILGAAPLGVWIEQVLAPPAARGFTLDLLVSALTFLIWSFTDARRRGFRGWWRVPVVMTTIGLSCAFPLYLWLRQRHPPR